MDIREEKYYDWEEKDSLDRINYQAYDENGEEIRCASSTYYATRKPSQAFNIGMSGWVSREEVMAKIAVLQHMLDSNP